MMWPAPMSPAEFLEYADRGQFCVTQWSKYRVAYRFVLAMARYGVTPMSAASMTDNDLRRLRLIGATAVREIRDALLEGALLADLACDSSLGHLHLGEVVH